jgi:hypothetical protein
VGEETLNTPNPFEYLNNKIKKKMKRMNWLNLIADAVLPMVKNNENKSQNGLYILAILSLLSYDCRTTFSHILDSNILPLSIIRNCL